MNSLGSAGNEARGGGERGGYAGGRDDEEASERDRSRRENQNRRGRTGRPPNPPRPPPRIFDIAPRPRTRSQDGHDNLRQPPPTAGVDNPVNNSTRSPSRTTQPSLDAHIRPIRTARHSGRYRMARQLTDNLAVDECLTEIHFLTLQGDWVTLPNALISPHWSQSFLPAWAADALEFPPSDLEGAVRRTYVTPRGPIDATRAVGLYIKLEELDLLTLMRIPIIHETNLGVSIILGKPFIEACFGKNNWPPGEGHALYVSRDISLSAYEEDTAAWAGNYYYDGDADFTAANNNVHPYADNDAMDYNLTGVGGAIGDYEEVPHWNVYGADGYSHEM